MSPFLYASGFFCVCRAPGVRCSTVSCEILLGYAPLKQYKLASKQACCAWQCHAAATCSHFVEGLCNQATCGRYSRTFSQAGGGCDNRSYSRAEDCMQRWLVTLMEAMHGTMFNVQNNIACHWQALKAELLPIACAGAVAKGRILARLRPWARPQHNRKGWIWDHKLLMTPFHCEYLTQSQPSATGRRPPACVYVYIYHI